MLAGLAPHTTVKCAIGARVAQTFEPASVLLEVCEEDSRLPPNMSWSLGSGWDVDLTKLAQSATEALGSAQTAVTEAAEKARESAEKAAASAESIFSLDNLQIEGGEKSDVEQTIISPIPHSAIAEKSSAIVKPDVNLEKLERRQRELLEELRVGKKALNDREVECQNLSEVVAAQQTQLLETSTALETEKKALAESKAEIKKILADKKLALEKRDDEILKVKRSCSDLEEQLSSAKEKADSLQASLTAANAELASARERVAETAAVTSPVAEVSASPGGQVKGRGKGKGGKGGGGSAADVSPVVARTTGGDESVAFKQIKTDLSESEKKRTALEERLDALRTELRSAEDENTAMERRARQAEEELQTAQAEIQKTEAASNAQSADHAKKLDEARSQLAKLKEQVAKLNADVGAKEELIKSSTTALFSAQSVSVDLRASIASKDSTIDDLQGKVSGLTEKMKDLMKKYAESKTKAQSLEQSEGAKATDSQKALQSKESEVLSLRLKLENAERTVSDQRAMSSELTDRYGEVQRELSRSKEKVAEQILQIEELQRELQSAVSATSGLAAEATATQDKLEQEKVSAARLQERLVSVGAEWEGKLSSIQKTLSAKITELQTENENLLQRLRSEDETAKALEEYKKRAQIALKKANSTSSTMASEVAEKQKQVDDALARLAESEEACSKYQQMASEKAGKLDCLQRDADALVAQKAELARALEVEQGKSSELSAALESANAAANQAKTSAATAATAAAAAAAAMTERTGRSKDTDSETGSAAMPTSAHAPAPVPSTPSWAVAAAAAAAGAGAGASSSSSSSGAELAASPVPALTQLKPEETKDENGKEEGAIQIDDGLTLSVKAPPSDQLFYVNKLHSQIEDLKREISKRGIEVEASQQELQTEREAKVSVSYSFSGPLAHQQLLTPPQFLSLTHSANYQTAWRSC